MATGERHDGAEASREPLGLRKDAVRIHPYTPEWAALFEREATRLRAILGDRVQAIEHVGSTSVPGLNAKPIVDIMVGTGSLDDAYELIPTLEQHGYRYLRRFHFVPRLFLVKGSAERGTHHLHLTPHGCPEWTKILLFRDELRAHSDVAAAYAALKLVLARDYPNDRDAYAAGKERFIGEILERAENERRAAMSE